MQRNNPLPLKAKQFNVTPTGTKEVPNQDNGFLYADIEPHGMAQVSNSASKTTKGMNLSGAESSSSSQMVISP